VRVSGLPATSRQIDVLFIGNPANIHANQHSLRRVG
jgi:hypothetical protein